MLADTIGDDRAPQSRYVSRREPRISARRRSAASERSSRAIVPTNTTATLRSSGYFSLVFSCFCFFILCPNLHRSVYTYNVYIHESLSLVTTGSLSLSLFLNSLSPPAVSLLLILFLQFVLFSLSFSALVARMGTQGRVLSTRVDSQNFLLTFGEIHAAYDHLSLARRETTPRVVLFGCKRIYLIWSHHPLLVLLFTSSSCSSFSCSSSTSFASTSSIPSSPPPLLPPLLRPHPPTTLPPSSLSSSSVLLIVWRVRCHCTAERIATGKAINTHASRGVNKLDLRGILIGTHMYVLVLLRLCRETYPSKIGASCDFGMRARIFR